MATASCAPAVTAVRAIGSFQPSRNGHTCSRTQQLGTPSACITSISRVTLDAQKNASLHKGLSSSASPLVRTLGWTCKALPESKRSRRGLSVQAKATEVDKATVIPEPDYRLALSLLGIAGTLAFGVKNELLAAPFGLLGALLAVQTSRVKFVFDKETLSVLIGEQLESSGENTFVGGENRWRFDTFTNWEFWWPNFPVLVYFKETQTKPEGQIHFFPVILNGKQLYEVMVERCGPSQTSGPK